MTTVSFPGDDFDRFRRQIEAMANPSALRMIREISERAQELTRPTALTALRDVAERSKAMARPEMLDLIQSTNLALSKAVEPSLLRLAEKTRADMEALVTPDLVRWMAEINTNLARERGDHLREYARRVGESLVDSSSVPPVPTAEIELAIEDEFVDLALAPRETSLLYWLFATYVSILGTMGGALNDEIARGFQTGLGLMMLFLAAQNRSRS